MRSVLLLTLLLSYGCGPESKPAVPQTEAAPKKNPPPADHARWFPKKDQVSMTLVPGHVMGKDFLPGGNVARYQRGSQQYEMFLIAAPDTQTPALWTFDYKKQMPDAKLIPHFGGYFGKDGGRHAFVFAKNKWLVGIVGLAEKDADLAARDFAGRLQ